MQRIGLKGYRSARQYLSDYCAYNRQCNSRFTLGMLARKMNLPQTATLSRILNGERKIGPELSAKLTQFFEFSQNEITIFDLLVRLDQEQESVIIEALKTKLNQLHNQVKTQDDLAFQFQAKSLNLWGEVKAKSLNDELKKFGFETIAGYGVSATPFCLNIAQVQTHGIDPFLQFAMAGYVKKNHQPLVESEIFFHHLVSNSPSLNQFYNKLGSPYEFGDLQGNFEESDRQILASCQNEKVKVEISFRQLGVKFEKFDQPNNIFGYNTLLKDQFAFPMRFRSTALVRPFDPNLDKCLWSTDFEMGRILEVIQFIPKFWTYHKDFNCEIDLPIQRYPQTS